MAFAPFGDHRLTPARIAAIYLVIGLLGLLVSDVLLDVPDEPRMTESTSRIVVNDDVRRLSEQSTLVSALRAAQRDQWRLGVYAPEPQSERVGNAAIRVLGLDLDGALVRDVRPGINATLDEFD